MRSASVQSHRDETVRNNTFAEDRFEDFGGQQPDLQTNSVEDVISEIGLVLVVILGAVVAINMMLVALHVG